MDQKNKNKFFFCKTAKKFLFFLNKDQNLN